MNFKNEHNLISYSKKNTFIYYLGANAKKLYHGDPSRNNHFWVYPPYKSLGNPQWDTYDPFLMCSNFTAPEENNYNQLRQYTCNGHEMYVI